MSAPLLRRELCGFLHCEGCLLPAVVMEPKEGHPPRAAETCLRTEEEISRHLERHHSSPQKNPAPKNKSLSLRHK